MMFSKLKINRKHSKNKITGQIQIPEILPPMLKYLFNKHLPSNVTFHVTSDAKIINP